MEVRGADGASWRRICALPALWTGLFYDVSSLDAAWDLVKDWTWEEQLAMKADVPAQGLRAHFRDGTLQDVTKQVLEISAEGLKNRAIFDGSLDEVHFLESLMEIAESGMTPADVLLEKYHNEWHGSVDPVFTAPTSLVTLALLGSGDRAHTLKEVDDSTAPLIEYIRRRQLPTTMDLSIDSPKLIEPTLQTLVASGVVTVFTEGPEAVYAIGPNQHLAAAYYRNTVIHFFVTAAIAELALLGAAGPTLPTERASSGTRSPD